jgi:hypothetical protein
MSEASNYNGWSNRETWVANLWLTNDQARYCLVLEALKHSGGDYTAAEWLQEQLRNQLDEEAGNSSMWSDLLSTASTVLVRLSSVTASSA